MITLLKKILGLGPSVNFAELVQQGAIVLDDINKNKLQSEPASYIERDQVLREKFSELEKKFDAMEEEILGFQESLEKVTFNTNILEDLNGRINTIVEEVSASDSKNELWFSIYSLSLKVIPILTFAALIILLINLSIILRWAFKKIWKRNASQSAE